MPTDPTQPARVIRVLQRLRDAARPRPKEPSLGSFPGPPSRTLDDALAPYLDQIRRDAPRVTTAGRILAFGILNPATDILERRLLALIDCVACVLDHDDYGGIFGARLALLAVVDPATAEAALQALTGEAT